MTSPIVETYFSGTNNIVALKRAFWYVYNLLSIKQTNYAAMRDCLVYLVSLGLLLSLLGQQYRLNVRQHTALCDSHAGEELVQLFVVAYRQLKMSRYDPGLLVVASGVSGQLEHFRRQIFHHGGQVHGSPGTDTFSVVALAEQPVNTPDGKLESCTIRTRLRLSLHFTSFTATRHFTLRNVK